MCKLFTIYLHTTKQLKFKVKTKILYNGEASNSMYPLDPHVRSQVAEI